MEAVGHSGRLKWYVAFVKSCQEKKSAEALSCLGVEHFLPVQKVVRQWSDRRKVVDSLLLPRMIFVRVESDARRRKLLSDVFGLYAYMTVPGGYKPLVVPDKQLEDFRTVVERLGADGIAQEEVVMTSEYIAPGDMVKIVAGPLTGMEAECVDVVGRAGRKAIVVRLGLLGTATVEVSSSDVEPLNKN